MKSEKGISLVSLIVYILAMAILTGILTVITNFFYSDMLNTETDVDVIVEYTKFNSYFSEEVNKSNIKVIESASDYIVFNNGVQYTYVLQNNAIYRNKVEICKGIQHCTFLEKIVNGNTVIEVTIAIGNDVKTVTYTLKS